MYQVSRTRLNALYWQGCGDSSPVLICHAIALPLNVIQHAAAPTETGSHDAKSPKDINWTVSLECHMTKS